MNSRIPILILRPIKSKDIRKMIVANNKLSNLKCNCLYLNLNNWLEAYCQKGRNVYCTQVVFLSNFYWNRETFHYFDPSNNIIAYHAITN